MSSPVSTKYLDALRYLLGSEANNDKLGKVKLMKLLYFADFDHYAVHNQSITGDTYYKLPYGPVPRLADVALKELEQAKHVVIKRQPVINYYKYDYSLQPGSFYPEKSVLTQDEKDTLDQVIGKWKGHSTQEMVSASHGEPTWQMVDFGEPIPYSYVRYRKQVCVQDEEAGVIPQEAQVAS